MKHNYSQNGESVQNKSEDESFKARLKSILDDTHTQLTHARISYGESWIERGGVGAFMNLARKWDRISRACERTGWDILAALEMDRRPEGLVDDLRDLRDYCLLVDEYWTRDLMHVPQYTKECVTGPCSEDLMPETPASKVVGEEIERLVKEDPMAIECKHCHHQTFFHRPDCSVCGCNGGDDTIDAVCVCGHKRSEHNPKLQNCYQTGCGCLAFTTVPHAKRKLLRDDDPVHPDPAEEILGITQDMTVKVTRLADDQIQIVLPPLPGVRYIDIKQTIPPSSEGVEPITTVKME